MKDRKQLTEELISHLKESLTHRFLGKTNTGATLEAVKAVIQTELQRISSAHPGLFPSPLEVLVERGKNPSEIFIFFVNPKTGENQNLCQTYLE